MRGPQRQIAVISSYHLLVHRRRIRRNPWSLKCCPPPRGLLDPRRVRLRRTQMMDAKRRVVNLWIDLRIYLQIER